MLKYYRKKLFIIYVINLTFCRVFNKEVAVIFFSIDLKHPQTTMSLACSLKLNHQHMIHITWGTYKIGQAMPAVSLGEVPRLGQRTWVLLW